MARENTPAPHFPEFQLVPSFLALNPSQDFADLSLLKLGGLEKTLESPLDCKEIQSVHSEGN